ncbi:hypothetical protein [Pseudolactococcus reticulitermitis]|uniref:Uncharacterized protein n=1 Tax=Pseudolactococcus reticulitermitis TaxID=2025039 RepID=A0A224XEA3_9LACT|nr:hypothetical protein [Lactococcus reticulitermitis]GAX48424.1 hypothetical protein RsY01_2047 [Lactococcus reticulitermitis]GHU37406.1 hypothetical protein FACS1894192_06260 [Bacilli bacterium]GHU40647.1 hypothetical protein FACS1894193_03240 [Bacilli bacterium]
MSEETPKVKKAAMLPNNFIMLDFDNGERRYLPSHFIQQYENALAGDETVAKGTRRTFAVSPTITFLGNEFDIQDDGTVMVNGKDRYTREELWQNSVAKISEVKRVIPDATHWKRNVVIALILALPLIIICVFAFLDGW